MKLNHLKIFENLMKTFFAIALAGIASALELEDNYLAQVTETVDGVTHPADSPLDRTHSTKTTGKVSYQVFFDKEVTNNRLAANDAGLSCGASFDANIHMCCFKFDIYQPFIDLTQRYAMTVQHNCRPFVNADYNIDFEGFSFAVDGQGSSSDHTYDIAHADHSNTFDLTSDVVSFQLNNIGTTESDFKHFSYFWSADTFHADNWSYTYELLSAAAASTAI
jgi:hypothetical protein